MRNSLANDDAAQIQTTEVHVAPNCVLLNPEQVNHTLYNHQISSLGLVQYDREARG